MEQKIQLFLFVAYSYNVFSKLCFYGKTWRNILFYGTYVVSVCSFLVSISKEGKSRNYGLPTMGRSFVLFICGIHDFVSN